MMKNISEKSYFGGPWHLLVGVGLLEYVSVMGQADKPLI